MMAIADFCVRCPPSMQHCTLDFDCRSQHSCPLPPASLTQRVSRVFETASTRFHRLPSHGGSATQLSVSTNVDGNS